MKTRNSKVNKYYIVRPPRTGRIGILAICSRIKKTSKLPKNQALAFYLYRKYLQSLRK